MKHFFVVLLLFVLFFLPCRSQTLMNQMDFEICEKIVYLDSMEFFSSKQNWEAFDSMTNIVKINGIIEIPLKDNVLIFEDDTTDAGYFEHFVIGEKDNWIVVMGQDYHKEYYYLINKITCKIDTLVGYPLIFHNLLLCVEGSYTDGTGYIELWKIKRNKAKLIKKFSLRYCKYPAGCCGEAYLKDDFFYWEFSKEKYMKIKI